MIDLVFDPDGEVDELCRPLEHEREPVELGQEEGQHGDVAHQGNLGSDCPKKRFACKWNVAKE